MRNCIQVTLASCPVENEISGEMCILKLALKLSCKFKGFDYATKHLLSRRGGDFLAVSRQPQSCFALTRRPISIYTIFISKSVQFDLKSVQLNVEMVYVGGRARGSAIGGDGSSMHPNHHGLAISVQGDQTFHPSGAGELVPYLPAKDIAKTV